MKTEQEIKEKLEEAEQKSTEATLDSHKNQEISPVNRGAMYGWAEALNWVLGDASEAVEDGEME